jgi:hypothetical protein
MLPGASGGGEERRSHGQGRFESPTWGCAKEDRLLRAAVGPFSDPQPTALARICPLPFPVGGVLAFLIRLQLNVWPLKLAAPSAVQAPAAVGALFHPGHRQTVHPPKREWDPR